MAGLWRGGPGLWSGTAGLWRGILGLWGGASGLITGGGTPAPTPPPPGSPGILTVTGAGSAISGAGLILSHIGPDNVSSIGGAATSGKTTGKYYYEYVVTSLDVSSGGNGIGVTRVGTPLDDNLGFTVGGACAYCDINGISVWADLSNKGDFPGAMASGTVVGCAYDADTRQIMWKVGAGAWTTPITLGDSGLPIMPAVNVNYTGDVATCRFASASWTLAPPDGTYGPWTVNAAVTAFDESFNDIPVLSYLDGGRIVLRSDDAGRRSVRSVVSHDGGKRYVELEAIGARARFVGVVDHTFDTNGAGGPAGTNRAGLQGANLVAYPGVIDPLGEFANPATIGRIAYDADLGLYWLALGTGDWNGSPTADPTTGVGGMSAAGLAGPAYIGVTLRPVIGAGVRIRQPGDVGYDLPSGYAEWSAP